MYLILIHILFYDLWFYISHIILHNKNIYYIHKIHHIAPYDKLTYSDTNVGHIIENVFSPAGIIIPCFIMDFSFLYLCISFIFVGIRALMRHDNRCIWLIGNHHILHHKYPNYNYGEYWIDKICGTSYPHKEEYIYGLIYM